MTKLNNKTGSLEFLLLPSGKSNLLSELLTTCIVVVVVLTLSYYVKGLVMLIGFYSKSSRAPNQEGTADGPIEKTSTATKVNRIKRLLRPVEPSLPITSI